MTAAHGGFGSEQVPLGGGAAVFERLCLAWANRSELELHTAGAGPQAPAGAASYHQLAAPSQPPSQLGMLAYARFCRDFERETTRHALDIRPDVVLTHDVSEGPDVAALRSAGIPVATIFHVDVVDIFGRLYMGSLLAPDRLTRAYRAARACPWPGVLRLVFEKQQQVLCEGVLNIVPSPGAAALLHRCYPEARTPIEVIGWGAPQPRFTEAEILQRAAELRHETGIPAAHRVLLTLSRLSPEKAQHRLLEALAVAQKEGLAPTDLTVVVAGEAAFMQGRAHEKRLRRLARELNTRVHFAGHVGGLDKAAWYRTADIFVVCSLHESYGLTTLEAMQQGCPVVAVRSFGTEATVGPRCGRLVLPGSELPRRLWGEISLLLRDDEARARLAQGAREQAQRTTFQAAADRVRLALEGAVPGAQP